MAARIIFSAVVAGAIASVLLAIASTRQQAAVGTASAAGSALPALGAGRFMVGAPKATQLWLTVSARSQQRVCPRANALPGYAARVRHALQAKRDLWGEELLHAPNGPTFEGADRHLAPLVYADSKRGRRMTQSGVYYLPFSSPTGHADNVGYALHVADGSEIITRRIRGRSLELFVGHQGRERYGACRARLAPARLAAGYLPILETSYVDAGGVRYRQESFVGSTGGKSPFVSFVHVVADAREADAGALIRLRPLRGDLRRVGDKLVSGGAARLVFSLGGSFDGSSVAYAVPRGRQVQIYACWINSTRWAGSLHANRATYDAARLRSAALWQRRLADGGEFVVPEQRVLDAERGVLIQQLELVWRYSVGNPYEELSFAEALDNAKVMAGYNFRLVSKEIIRVALKYLPDNFTNWRAGAILSASALHYSHFHDGAFLRRETPELEVVLDALDHHLEPGLNLLGPEPYSVDIQREVYGLHSQTVAWEGLNAIGRAWASAGHPRDAARSLALAATLETGLRREVRSSIRRLPEGTIFVPIELRERRLPFDRLTATREGSYWNLVAPFALASGFFRPGSPDAHGLLSYLLRHGSRLLGLVRSNAESLYGKQPYPVTGIDQVYGLNVARFLSNNDEPDQLVLSLYGTLAAAMTPNTFISGESASVAPLDGGLRTMLLPPNSGANASFLETLKLTLIRETTGPRGAPRGLDLAFATPRPWLADGKTIDVRKARTSFGLLSYSIQRHGEHVRATVRAPTSPPPRHLRLRLRLPAGEQIRSVRLGGHCLHYDARTSTIDLSGRGHRLVVDVTLKSDRADDGAERAGPAPPSSERAQLGEIATCAG